MRLGILFFLLFSIYNVSRSYHLQEASNFFTASSFELKEKTTAAKNPKNANAENYYICKSGIINFVSDAPLEIIEAKSTALNGVIDTKKKTFIFSVRMTSFQGFNSDLQLVHFNENYMESTKFPEATFKGKIIEEFDLTKKGSYLLRAKGFLTVHGIEKERIINIQINVESGKISVVGEFGIKLEDHNIRIPRIVNQKIAEEINVNIKMSLLPKQ